VVQSAFIESSPSLTQLSILDRVLIGGNRPVRNSTRRTADTAWIATVIPAQRAGADHDRLQGRQGPAAVLAETLAAWRQEVVAGRSGRVRRRAERRAVGLTALLIAES
jgi:hypothetical protein